jgi:signal transduction histidine kinase
MNLKKIFTKHLLVITIIFPLFLILFYGISVSFALKYKHEIYTEKELSRYEKELRDKDENFLQEKAKYIESFMSFIYAQNKDSSKILLTKEIFKFIASIKYDNGFIFFFQKKGNLVNIIRHPCGKKLFKLVQATNQESIISKLINSANNDAFINYQGTDCFNKQLINKVALVQRIKTTNYYIIISERNILYSIVAKKNKLEEKLNDELSGNLKLLFIVIVTSIIFSLIFSKTMNMLILDYEKEIKNSNKAMFSQSRLAQAGEMLSMISHQWRQPISKIASIASHLRFQMMMGNTINENELDKELNTIEEHTEFLSETIDDFKEFYKPKSIKETSSILPVINKALSFLQNELSKKSIILTKKFDKDREALIYPNELVQVLINIIQNAIELSKAKASITISTKAKIDEYVISIKDEAGGIKDENIDKIFNAHFSTKSEKNSTNLGLGLYVSKVIIESHFNGKLEVESQGKNTTFIIRLPL